MSATGSLTEREEHRQYLQNLRPYKIIKNIKMAVLDLSHITRGAFIIIKYSLF
jgi:hypothetical protein